MQIISWNVNGIRAAEKKGFLAWLAASGADVVGVQETKAWPEQLSPELLEPEGREAHYAVAERKGYSGVALFVSDRLAPFEIETCEEVEEFGREGRVQLARIGKLLLANVYFPNGSGKNRDNGRVPFKLEFYRKLFDLLEEETVLGWTGSSGSHMPEDVRRNLDALRELVDGPSMSETREPETEEPETGEE